MKKGLFTLTIFIIALLFVPSAALADGRLSSIRSWVVFYGETFPKKIPSYDLYILSSIEHPDLEPLINKGKKVAGYLSIGEISKTDPLYEEAKKKNLLVDENANWPGSYRVKIGNNKWHKLVINQMVPKIVMQGFGGIFLDTVDTAEYLEEEKKLPKQISGAIKLIEKIRKKYPELIIILNNGLFMADNVGKAIDALMVEDIYTLYDFEKKKYLMAKPEWVGKRLVSIKSFQNRFHKPILALDYLKPTSRHNIEKVSAMSISEGFLPYIATIDLNEVFFHP